MGHARNLCGFALASLLLVGGLPASAAMAAAAAPEPVWTEAVGHVARAVSVQDGRFVYVAGWRDPPGPTFSALVLRKLRLDGRTVWTRRWEIPNGVVPWDVAVGPDGQIAVGGHAACEADSECIAWFVRLYSTHGDRLWTRAPGLHGKVGAGFVTGVVVTQDQVVISGHCCGWGDTDGFVRAYGLDGGGRWHTDLGVPGARRFNEAANAIAVGPGGDLLVAGWVARGREDLGSEADHDVVVWRLRDDGGVRWTRRLPDRRAEDSDTATSVAALGGRIALAGIRGGEQGLGGSPWVAVLSEDGDLRWSDHFGRTRFFMSAPAVAIQPSGSVAVTGTIRDPTGTGVDAILRRYTATGRLRWSLATADDEPYAFATDVAPVGRTGLLVAGYITEDRREEGTGGFVCRI